MSVTLNASTSSGLVQTADTSGTIELQSNGTTRLTVASGGVTANNLSLNSTAITSFGGGVITSGTAVASTSGTSIDFTSIPSWVKRITVEIIGVSTNGTSNFLIQLGTSGGIVSTGYLSGVGSRSNETTSTAGFIVGIPAAAGNNLTGIIPICNYTTNAWVTSGVLSRQDGFLNASGGSISSLGGTLDRIRITTVNGTDTFDAGSINILYEG